MPKKISSFIIAILSLFLLFPVPARAGVDPADVPEYDGEPYVEINDNVPSFDYTDTIQGSFESYSDLDELGRCQVAVACIGTDIMPTEERGAIGKVKPTGWHTVKYDCVDGKYLYNRCHLIGYQLTGENANEKNLITGTRYLNVEGMLPFENMVADYIKETGNHVMYRVTPIFEDDNLVANGVQMEAESLEDDEISFNVFCYNVQPGVEIDYATGDSRASDAENITQKDAKKNSQQSKKSREKGDTKYIINKNTKKFHYPDCPSVTDMKPKNRKEYAGTREELIEKGYDPCGKCKP